MTKRIPSWRGGIDVRILVDTAVLIFAVESPERLTHRAAAILENPENVLDLSAVSLSEIAIKAALGKLRLSATTVRQAIDDLGIRVLPYTREHALKLFDLPLSASRPFRSPNHRPGVGRIASRGYPG
jgi:PIN domain nuclease of toxin-antitoxin system